MMAARTRPRPLQETPGRAAAAPALPSLRALHAGASSREPSWPCRGGVRASPGCLPQRLGTGQEGQSPWQTGWGHLGLARSGALQTASCGRAGCRPSEGLGAGCSAGGGPGSRSGSSCTPELPKGPRALLSPTAGSSSRPRGSIRHLPGSDRCPPRARGLMLCPGRLGRIDPILKAQAPVGASAARGGGRSWFL